MINATKADGQVSADEVQRIAGHLQQSGADEEALSYMQAAMQQPMQTEALVAAVGGRQELAAEVYAASLLAIEVDTNLPAARIVRVLERIVAWRGLPEKLRMDNGPELISVTLADRAKANSVELEFIQPGKPTQNSYVERFNKTYRNEILDFYLFSTLTEVKEITRTWIKEYNEERPHDSLGKMTPAEFVVAHSTQNISTYGWY